jgi:hypothetical protein
LERVAGDLIAPYAKAIGAEGYRFNVDLFAKRFGLNYLKCASTANNPSTTTPPPRMDLTGKTKLTPEERKQLFREINERSMKRSGRTEMPRTALDVILSRGSAVMSLPVSAALRQQVKTPDDDK